MNIFVLIVVLIAQVSSDQRDLIEEAQEQLDQLRSIVQGEILVAHSGLEEIDDDFIAFGNNLLLESIFTMQLEEQAINQQLTTLKDLANTANKDVSSCIDARQLVIGQLQAEYETQLGNCISENFKEEGVIVSDAKYIVDVAINKVHNIEFQLGLCRRDLACISPLITEIQLDKIRLPENIKTEVNDVKNRVGVLRLLLQQCSDTAMADYIAHTGAIVREIIDCVDKILD